MCRIFTNTWFSVLSEMMTRHCERFLSCFLIVCSIFLFLCSFQELELKQEELEEAKKQQDVLEAAIRKLPVLEKELTKLKEDNKFLRYIPL